MNPRIASNAPQMGIDILAVSEVLTSNGEMDDTKGGFLDRGAGTCGPAVHMRSSSLSRSPVTMSGICKGSPLSPLLGPSQPGRPSKQGTSPTAMALGD